LPLPKYNGSTTRPARKIRIVSRCAQYAVVVLALTVAREATAQRVTGPWEDGTIAPRGVFRIGISPRFEQWKERHARETGEREPLGADFTRDSLGPAFFPFVAGLAPPLTTLTGLPSPPPRSDGWTPGSMSRRSRPRSRSTTGSRRASASAR
jgi:hypothetical protein